MSTIIGDKRRCAPDIPGLIGGHCCCVESQREADVLMKSSLYGALEKYRRNPDRIPPQGRPNSILLHRTMMFISRDKPRTLVELRALWGIGDKKRDSYGSDILLLVEFFGD